MTETALDHPLPDELVELVAGRFKALADPTRIRLLDHLMAGEATVGELCEAVGTTQQNVSKQMLLLRGAGLVDRRRQGNFVYYRVAGPEVGALCATVCASLRATAGAILATAS